MAGTALAFGISTSAVAQEASEADSGLQEIIVTAQKREQSMQDVPIAVTALTGDTLATNRVTTVSDLTGLAPGVIVRTAAGGSQLPSFSIRGAISYGVVPGSDKQVSIYIDGVYMAAARGAIFDLPDVERIEMLRGPQGTLFGRNATAGAVSISTREPTGDAGVKATLTLGNYDHKRFRLSMDTPQMGPFSGYISYVHNYKRGDIRNAGAGQVWDRTAAGLGIKRSPNYLGTRDSDSYFAALKFEPSDTFKTTYKFDYSAENGTPEGTGFVGVNASAPGAGALFAPLVGALTTTQPFTVYAAPDGKRPKVVNNSWAIPSIQKNYGHSLTTTLELADNLSIKNVASYRYSRIFATSSLTGIDALPLTPQAAGAYAGFIAFSQIGTTFPDVASALAAIPTIAASLAPLHGQPFVTIGTQPESITKQWSDELQVNYNSDLLTLTAGGIWFHSKEVAGSPGMPGNVAFTAAFGGVISGAQAVNYNTATSLAAYAQAEVHISPQLDLVGGIRLTRDKKTGSLVYGSGNALTTVPFSYKKTKPNYLLGVNYKPTDDILLYGKFSTAFVSGGSVSGLVFEPETATSWEAGVKADLFDRKLRTNLALYHVTYKNFQTAQSGSNFPFLFTTPPYPPGFSSLVGLIIVPQGGPVKAKGFEFEATAAPVRGLTIGGSLSYMDTKFEDVNPALLLQQGGDYQPALRAKWTGGLWGQFETQPIAGDMTFMARVDGQWHSKFWMSQNRVNLVPAFKGIDTVSASWNVNARAALRNIQLGPIQTEFAVWARNLTQNREATFALQQFGAFGSANYVPARTFGADLSIEF
jgi:iron complex outermembrane receptor protein